LYVRFLQQISLILNTNFNNYLTEKHLVQRKKSPLKAPEENSKKDFNSLNRTNTPNNFQDPEFADRKIKFERGQQSTPKTISLKEKTRVAFDAAGNTGQTLKYLNYSLENQISKIQKIKKEKNEFQKEIESLLEEKTINTFFLPKRKKQNSSRIEEKISKDVNEIKTALDFLKAKLQYNEDKEIQNWIQKIETSTNSINIELGFSQKRKPGNFSAESSSLLRNQEVAKNDG